MSYKQVLDTYRDKITSFLKKKEVSFPESASLEELADIADNYWVTAKCNSHRKGKRCNNKITPEWLLEFKEFFLEHTKEETAEHFNLSVSTVKKYAMVYKIHHTKEFTSAIRSLRMLNNSNPSFKRGTTVKKKKQEVKSFHFIKFR